MNDANYEITWITDGQVVARSEMRSWLGVHLLKWFAVCAAFFDHQNHKIIVRKLKC